MRWRTIIGWTLGAFGILLIAAFVGGYFFLQSNRFQALVIRKIVQEADEATGGHTQIRAFDFQLSTLTAHLYGITLQNAQASGNPPLLSIDKLTVGLKILSILHRKVGLSELLIEHPVAHVHVDRDGNNNLPHAATKSGSGNSSVFDLAVGHVLVSKGEVDYNDRSIPVNADLYGLKTEINYSLLENNYGGSIAYESGKLQYENYPALSHSLQASFKATPTRLALDSAILKLGSSTLSLQGELNHYDNPIVEAHYDGKIHTQDFSALSQPLAPAGDVSLSGTIHYQGAGQEPLLHSIAIDGQIASDQIAAESPQARVALRHVQGHYRLSDGTFQTHDFSFETLGGKVAVIAEIQHLESSASGKVRATLQGVSLGAAEQALRTQEVRRVHLVSKLGGTIATEWSTSINNLQGHADLSLNAGNKIANQSSRDVPVEGTIHAAYRSQSSTITFRDTSLRISSTTITLQGEAANHSSLRVQATIGDLHGLADVVVALGVTLPPSLQVAGSASLNASMTGTLQKPQIAGQLNARNLRVQGSEWSSAKFDVQANPARASIQNGVLVSTHQGKASFSGSVALQNWAYAPSSPLAVNLSVQHMSLAELQQLANLQYPVSGDLSAEISLRGSQLDPGGSGSARIENARIYDEPVRHLAADFHTNQGTVTSTLDVSLPAGSANATLSYTPKTKAYAVRLSTLEVALQKLQAVQAKNLGVAGTLTISATGNGTLDDPKLTADVEVPQLQVRDKVISQLKGRLSVANQRAELTFDLQIAQASVHSHANVNLSGDYYADAAIDTSNVPLDPLLAMFVPTLPQGFQGATELHATLKGPLKDRSRMEAHLTIPTLKASYQSLEIAAAAPIRADYANSIVTLQLTEIRGTGTSLNLKGAIPLEGTAAISLNATGSIDLHILGIFNPDLKSSGALALDIHASGTAKDPAIQGQVHLQDVALSTPTAPLGVQKLNGTIDLGSNTLKFSDLAGEVGGGEVSLGGSIIYRPALQFNVSLQSKAVRLRYPDGLRALLDGNLVLSGTKDASTLNGRVLIDSLSFTSDFDLAKFSDQFSGATVPAQPGLADNVNLTIAVQSKNTLNATSSQLSLEGQVNLQVVGTAANPVVTGRTDLTSGELFYRNVRYQLQRGIITFDNPTITEPVLNLSATTTVEQYNLTL